MKKVLTVMGFKKADEMEKNIQLQSMRYAWTYTSVFLLVWYLYEINIGTGNLLPIILFLSSYLVFVVSRLIIEGRITSGVNEEREVQQPEPKAKQPSFIGTLLKINAMATPKVVSVTMVIVIIIMMVRYITGW